MANINKQEQAAYNTEAARINESIAKAAAERTEILEAQAKARANGAIPFSSLYVGGAVVR